MVSYPIHVPREMYSGINEARRRKRDEYNEIAKNLEIFINKKIEASSDEFQKFSYSLLSIETGIPDETVRDVLFALDGGHNGFTVQKPITK